MFEVLAETIFKRDDASGKEALRAFCELFEEKWHEQKYLSRIDEKEFEPKARMYEMPENNDAATNDVEANPDLGEAMETPVETNSGEEHNTELDAANLSAWENRSAAQKRYLGQKRYQEVLERGRKNRKLILRCMRDPGTVVIDKLPKQIREMTYSGFDPNAVRDPSQD